MTSPREIQRLVDRERLAPHYQRALTEPDATLGWSGDPDLVLAFNRLENRYEIFREEASQNPRTGEWETFHRIIARAPEGERLDVTQMIRGLVARDTQISSHEAQMERHLKELVQEEEEREARMIEAITPVHEKLTWATAKHTGDARKVVSLSTPKGLVS